MGARRRVATGTAALALALCACAGAASGLRLSLVSAPATAVTATPVPVTVAAASGGKPLRGAKVQVWIRRGGPQRFFAARPSGRAGRYTARVTFSTAGRWTLGARIGRVSRTFRTIAVTEPLRVREPFRVVPAADGSLLVPDGTANRILRVDPANGNVSSFAGTGSAQIGPAGGDARTTSIGRPIEAAVAPNGDVAFVSDERVWKIEAGAFALRHVAGTTDGHSGDGGPATHAQLEGPTGLAYDSAGNLFICEYGGYVRRVDAQSGVITTIAGIGADASTGDGGPATAAAINRPHGLVVTPDGTVFVSDSYGTRLRASTGAGRSRPSRARSTARPGSPSRPAAACTSRSSSRAE
jgi:sugar lactone lactonase YvrE